MYQQHLSDAIQFLDEVEIRLCEAMLNLMMSGELNNWDKSSPEDDVINVDDSLFEASEDGNIHVLLKLYRQLRVASQNLHKSR